VEITIIHNQLYTRLAILLLKMCVWLVKDDCKFHIVLIFEQKNGTSLHTPHYKDTSSLKQPLRGQYRLSVPVIYIMDNAPSSTWNSPCWISRKMKKNENEEETGVMNNSAAVADASSSNILEKHTLRKELTGTRKTSCGGFPLEPVFF
jgi:hypothetical protein